MKSEETIDGRIDFKKRLLRHAREREAEAKASAKAWTKLVAELTVELAELRKKAARRKA